MGREIERPLVLPLNRKHGEWESLQVAQIPLDFVGVYVGGEGEAVGVEENEEILLFGGRGDGGTGALEGVEVVEGFVYESKGAGGGTAQAAR